MPSSPSAGSLAGLLFPQPASHADGVYQSRMRAVEIENAGLVKQIEALEHVVAALQAEREEVRKVLAEKDALPNLPSKP